MNDMNGFDIDRNSLDVMDEVGDLVTDGVVQIEYGCFFFLVYCSGSSDWSVGNPRLRIWSQMVYRLNM